MQAAVLMLLVWATLQFELPGNHLQRAESVSATDYKLLTATLDPFSESSGATFFFFYPAIFGISCQLNRYQEADLSPL